MDIITLGLMVCDIIVKPVSKKIFENDVTTIDAVKMASGGDAFNVAINLARIGISSGIIAKVGRDEFGSFLLNKAVENNVNTNGVKETKKKGTATCIDLIRQDGERHYAFYGGANDLLKEEDIDFKLIREAQVLAVGGAGLLPGLDGKGMSSVLKKARKMGVTTSVDVSGELNTDFNKKLKQVLPYTDIFIPSYYQAKYFTNKKEPEEIAKILRDYGAGIVILKMGEKGCYIASDDERLSILAYKVKVVDTIGAGDAFVAGFLAAYLKGWSLFKCAQFANATGAFCVQATGPTAGIKPFAKIQEFINENKK